MPDSINQFQQFTMNNTHSQYFLLYASCIPVKGISRSSIYDIQRNCLRLIPNLIYDVIKDAENRTAGELKKKYYNEYDKEIDIFFQELIEDELGFFTDTPKLFPKLSLAWESSSQISNAIIEIKEKSELDYNSIFSQLDDLGCTSIELRFTGSPTIDFIEHILTACNHSRIVSISMILPYADQFQIDNISYLSSKNLRVNKIIIHSAKENKKISNNYMVAKIYYTTSQLNNSSCGQICKENLIINSDLFRESQKYNSCLNKKVTITENGDIKNCPSFKKKFSNIKVKKLKEAITDAKFQELWHIRKDNINICKSCEFRYSCMDCRAYTQDPKNKYSKPLKCSYDPKTMSW